MCVSLQGVLEIYHGGVPLSLQQAYGILLACGDLRVDQYQVYAHLCRLGYIVRRHVAVYVDTTHLFSLVNRLQAECCHLSIDSRLSVVTCQ